MAALLVYYDIKGNNFFQPLERRLLPAPGMERVLLPPVLLQSLLHLPPPGPVRFHLRHQIVRQTFFPLKKTVVLPISFLALLQLVRVLLHAGGAPVPLPARAAPPQRRPRLLREHDRLPLVVHLGADRLAGRPLHEAGLPRSWEGGGGEGGQEEGGQVRHAGLGGHAQAVGAKSNEQVDTISI